MREEDAKYRDRIASRAAGRLRLLLRVRACATHWLVQHVFVVMQNGLVKIAMSAVIVVPPFA